MEKIINNNMNDVTKKVEEVALYVRVSTEEQAINGDSLRTQRDELTKYALSNNFHIIGIYEDDGFSATNLKRPALQKMLEDVKQGKINRILITKLDRLSRGVRNYYKILDVLDENEVYWTTVFEKYDSSTANGRLHINIMLSVAENESAQTSERIKSVFKTKLQSKEIVSGSIAIGYKKQGKVLVIDETYRQFVIDTFEYYIKFNSVYKTFENFTLQKGLNYSQTFRLLHNKLYIGIKQTKYGDIENFCSPIVSKELFYKVQNLLQKNERKRVSIDDILIFSGMLRCLECNHKLSGKIYKKAINTTSKYYYLCNQARMTKRCNNMKNLNEVKIEKKLLANINDEIQKYIDICETRKIQIKKNNTENEKNKINKQLERLRDLYVRDMIQIEHYEKQYKELTTRLNELNSLPNEEKIINNIEPLKSFLASDFLLIYNKLNRQEKRRIWLSIIDKIYIDKDYNMKIIFL